MFTLGAHLSSKRTGYTHHGIYIGGGKVIHYSGLANGLNKGRICETTFDEFNQNQETVKIIEHLASSGLYSNVDIVKRAKSRLGEDKYNVFNNNCEHFATWCVTGKSESAQVKTVSHTVSIGSLGYNAYQAYKAYQTAQSASTLVSSAMSVAGKQVAARAITSGAMSSSASALAGLTSTASGAGLTTAAFSGGASTLLGVTGASAATVAAAPVALAAGGIALVGYGAYKLWEWFDD